MVQSQTKQPPLVQQPFIGILVAPNVSSLVVNPNNDNWGSTIYAKPVQSIHGWATILPLSPPHHSHISHLHMMPHE